MNKIVLIPLTSLVVIGTAALVHELSPVASDTKVVEKVESFEMKLDEPRYIPPGKFARPPAPPTPPAPAPAAPHPAPSR